MTALESPEPLYVTHGRSKVHIQACPHLTTSSRLVPATAEQIAENGLCIHCEKEILGVGRSYYDTLDDAFVAFGHRTDEARRLIREALAGVEYEQIWIPASLSYIALGKDKRGVAWIGKGYVDFYDKDQVELPWFEPHSGGGAQVLEERGDLCDVHNVEKSVTGECEMCD